MRSHPPLFTRHPFALPGALTGLAIALFGLIAPASRAADSPASSASPAQAEPARDAAAAAKPETYEAGYLQRRWAGTDLTALAAALAAWRREHGSWPADCPAAAAARLSPAPSADPWGSAYSCDLSDPPRVLSAGPDRQPGTSDDIAYRLDGAGLVAPAAAPAGPAGPGASEPAAPAPPATEEAKTTTDRLVWLARALESYRKREGHYPVADQAEHLEQWLVPADLPPSQWFETDGWDRPWRYRVTDTGVAYSLASSGADGRWEALASAEPAAAANANADLIVADGAFLRWPADFKPEAVSAGAPRRAAGSPGSPASTPEPKDPAERTTWRLDRIAARLAKLRAANGAFPASDDAQRLAEEIGAGTPATDGWGRPLEYLSASAGARYALVSRGKDGKLARSMEEYARGAEAAGDDMVSRP